MLEEFSPYLHFPPLLLTILFTLRLHLTRHSASVYSEFPVDKSARAVMSSCLSVLPLPLFICFNILLSLVSLSLLPKAPLISTATQAHTSFTLTCPAVQGDYVLLHWQPPDARKRTNMKLVYQYDRWRGSTLLTEQSKKLQLAGPPYNPEAGSFSFLLTPGWKDGGLYACDVFLNSVAFSQRTRLSVLKGTDQREEKEEEVVSLK